MNSKKQTDRDMQTKVKNTPVSNYMEVWAYKVHPFPVREPAIDRVGNIKLEVLMCGFYAFEWFKGCIPIVKVTSFVDHTAFIEIVL
jgi:hypothetical protein